MPEYRIVAKIDPSGVTAGRGKVRQELQGMEADFQRAGRTGAASMDRMTAAEFRAAGGVKGLADASSRGAQSQKELERAAQRVIETVDQEAAAQGRMNRLLADAKRALDAGKISTEQYARVQQLAAEGHANLAQNLGRTRAGFTQLSFQLGDISQQMALGTRGSTIFAQQSGQVIQALQLMGGGGNAFLKFLGGPWGIAISTAAVVLLPLISNLLDVGSALDQEVDKLKKDAESEELARKAKELFAHTEEGVRKAILDANEARKESIKQARTEAEQANMNAIANLKEEVSIRKKTAAQLEFAQEQLRGQMMAAQAPGQRGELASLTLQMYQGQVDALQNRLAEQTRLIGLAQGEFKSSVADLAIEQAKLRSEAAASPEGKINADYAAATKALNDQYKPLLAAAGATDDLNHATAEQIRLTDLLTKKLTALTVKRDADLKALQQTSDGVERFRSREQAIGMAGRELQGQGFDISGNKQFRTTTGHANDADHNRFAIDVNQSSQPGRSTGGIVEANVPDLRTHFDQLARSYQARGYKVLWNGQVYSPNGNGPSGRIPAGQDQHHDHMHLYAPGTIVGRETGASTAAQEAQQFKAEQTVAEQKRDFVSQIVDGAGVRGQPSVVESTQAKLQKVFDDYRRRFNEDISPTDKAAVTKALTEAEAREIAQHFDEAYNKPLERLALLQGQTGLAREVLNAQLAESERLGRALTPIEAQQIENSIKKGDALKNEAQILEEVRGPVDAYAKQIAYLNDLLSKSAISQTEFNARIAELGAAALNSALGDMPGMDTGTGQSYDQLTASADEDARYARQLATFEQYKATLLARGIDWNNLIFNAELDHQRRMESIQKQTITTRLNAAQNLFSSLADIAEAGLGKQSAIYKAMFIASKAFAIADSVVKIQQALAQALSLPFPENLPALAQVAALGASIISNLVAVKLNLAEGGMVRGPGGPTDDKVGANLSAGEYVVRAAAVQRPGNLALLEAMNSGALTAGMRRASNDNLGTKGQVGGDTYQINIGDVNVHAGSGVTGEDGRQIGQDVKRSLTELIDERITVATRPGGRLTRLRQSAVE